MPSFVAGALQGFVRALDDDWHLTLAEGKGALSDTVHWQWYVKGLVLGEHPLLAAEVPSRCRVQAPVKEFGVLWPRIDLCLHVGDKVGKGVCSLGVFCEVGHVGIRQVFRPG